MMLRIAAAASVVLGVTVLMLYLGLVGKAPWSTPQERHLRAMKDRTAVPDSLDPVTFQDMAALPRKVPVARYGLAERRAVSLEGYVQRMLRAPDGDIHLDFADTLESQSRLVPFLSAEVTPQWHLGSRWRYERLVALFRPHLGGQTPWDEPPRRVRLSGWLMYDFENEGTPMFFGFPPKTTYWEIHPVTRIEAWDDSLKRFVEFPR